jgi:hypothetical protein
MSNMLTVLLIGALIVFLVAIGPLAGIWALNTLFPVLAIPYSFSTWLAAAVLMAVLAPNVKVTKKG